MKATPKVKQIEAKSVVRKIYLQDVDASNFLNFAQTLSTDISIVTDETLEQQEQE